LLLQGGVVRVGDADFDHAVELTIAFLREAARVSRDEEDALVTYRQLSEHLAGGGLDVPYHDGLMPHVLGEASRREDAQGRGMISALVVQ
jgi:hypothetical protein